MSVIYIYDLDFRSNMLLNSVQVSLTREGNHWGYFCIDSLEFTIEYEGQSHTYELPTSGKYALYSQELIKITPSAKKILFVSDLDGTLYKETPEALQAYDRFVKFWIKYFQFNGSKLVYNTGRSVSGYREVKHSLYIPDLAILQIGSYGYSLDQTGDLVLQEDYRTVLSDIPTDGWNPEVLAEALKDEFEFLKPLEHEVHPLNVFFIIPDDLTHQHFKSIKKFIKNKSNEPRKGLVLSAKCVASKHLLVNDHFLEVYPHFSGKQVGIVYCQRVFGFGNEDTVVSGDSSNDIDMFKFPVHGVLVGNAEPGIVDWIQRKPRPLKSYSQLKYADAVTDFLQKFIV
jgi:sucrose-6-phosphatase